MRSMRSCGSPTECDREDTGPLRTRSPHPCLSSFHEPLRHRQGAAGLFLHSLGTQEGLLNVDGLLDRPLLYSVMRRQSCFTLSRHWHHDFLHDRKRLDVDLLRHDSRSTPAIHSVTGGIRISALCAEIRSRCCTRGASTTCSAVHHCVHVRLTSPPRRSLTETQASLPEHEAHPHLACALVHARSTSTPRQSLHEVEASAGALAHTGLASTPLSPLQTEAHHLFARRFDVALTSLPRQQSRLSL